MIPQRWGHARWSTHRRLQTDAPESEVSNHTHVSLKLDFASQKKGGMAVPAVLRLVHLLAPYRSEPWYPPPYTGGASGSESLRIGETPVPLSKSPKGIGFGYQYCAITLTG